MVFVVMRIRNTTPSGINWTPFWYWSAYGGWNEYASFTINGAGTWNSACNCYPNNGVSVTVTLPANRVSTLMWVTGSSPAPVGNVRGVTLTFYSDSLVLPAGLQYVDDLGVTSGGWES
jgi:hypothetical protein